MSVSTAATVATAATDLSPRQEEVGAPPCAPVDRPYEKHVFVCTYGAWCQLDGGKDVHKRMKTLVKEAGLRDVCRVNQSGCLNQCGNGPMLVVYPDNVWYDKVDLAKAERIVAEHVVGGRPVEELRYRPQQAGNNKTATVRAAEAAKKGT